MTFFRSTLSRIGQGSASLLRLYHPSTLREKGWLWASGLVLITLVILLYLLALYWSQEPDAFDVREVTRAQLGELQPVVGSHTTASLVQVMETLLDKPGGYLSNDVTPPTVFLDNIPSWE